MRDVYTNTERDAARHEAQHADRWPGASDFDAADDTLGREPRAASPGFVALCARLVAEAGGRGT